MIDQKTLSRWATRARRSAYNKLVNLLEFREMIPDFKAEGVLMEAYKEAGAAMMISPETLRRDIATIREYSKQDLVRWIRQGVSFDHLDTANSLYEIAHKSPKQLIEECIDPGNATGETMTVPELTAFALGEREIHPAVYQVNVWISRLCNFPTVLGWADEKRARFDEVIKQLKEFFE